MENELQKINKYYIQKIELMNPFKFLIFSLLFATLSGCASKSKSKNDSLDPESKNVVHSPSTGVASLKILTPEQAKNYVDTFYHSQCVGKCKALAFWISKQQLEYLQVFQNMDSLRNDEGIRFYFGKYSNLYNTPCKDSGNEIILMAVATKKNADGAYKDFPKNGILNLGTNTICPADCRGTMLLFQKTINELKKNETCKGKFDTAKSNIKPTSSWGNMEKDEALQRINSYYLTGSLIEPCKTLSVHFDERAIKGLIMLTRKLTDTLASGIRAYIMSYVNNLSTPFDEVKKTSLILTITEQIQNAAGQVYHQDVLGAKGPSVYFSPLNNGSRCPPGKDADLVEQLIAEKRISIECFPEKQKNK